MEKQRKAFMTLSTYVSQLNTTTFIKGKFLSKLLSKMVPKSRISLIQKSSKDETSTILIHDGLLHEKNLTLSTLNLSNEGERQVSIVVLYEPSNSDARILIHDLQRIVNIYSNKNIMALTGEDFNPIGKLYIDNATKVIKWDKPVERIIVEYFRENWFLRGTEFVVNKVDSFLSQPMQKFQGPTTTFITLANDISNHETKSSTVIEFHELIPTNLYYLNQFRLKGFTAQIACIACEVMVNSDKQSIKEKFKLNDQHYSNVIDFIKDRITPEDDPLWMKIVHIA
jgi:hypothetical protein